jgi:hypothetical protein
MCFGETRKVNWQSLISVGGAQYSVPHELIDERVWARSDGEELVVVLRMNRPRGWYPRAPSTYLVRHRGPATSQPRRPRRPAHAIFGGATGMSALLLARRAALEPIAGPDASSSSAPAVR